MVLERKLESSIASRQWRRLLLRILAPHVLEEGVLQGSGDGDAALRGPLQQLVEKVARLVRGVRKEGHPWLALSVLDAPAKDVTRVGVCGSYGGGGGCSSSLDGCEHEALCVILEGEVGWGPRAKNRDDLRATTRARKGGGGGSLGKWPLLSPSAFGAYIPNRFSDVRSDKEGLAANELAEDASDGPAMGGEEGRET